MVHKSENFLKGLGLAPLRVRHHGNLARIEVSGNQLDRVLANAEKIAAAIKKIGYTYVSLDLIGYRTGSMNETLAGDIIESARNGSPKDTPPQIVLPGGLA
jgi:uncharacterized protein